MLEFYNYNLLCFSEDWLMQRPKEDYKEQWKNEKQKVVLLENLIDEFKGDFIIDNLTKKFDNVKYYVRSKENGLLAGFRNFKDAKEYANEYKVNNNIKVGVYDKNGKNLYNAKAKGRYEEEQI